MDLRELLGAAEIEELGGGHQSRVFRVVRRGGDVVVAKVLDAAIVDRHELEARVAVIAALADHEPSVCGPLAIGRQLVNEITVADGRHHYVVCFEFADGTPLDPAVAADADQMGRVLSRLHTSMRRLPLARLPLVAALRAAPPASMADDYQLLHGDFNAGNLRKVDGVLRVFDLDDCGYGPPAFDVANALYMVLFDAVVQGTPGTYETFRRSFVDGYVDAARHNVDPNVLDELIDRRVGALGAWLDDLDHAPAGIRTASPEWRSTLRTFVTEYRPAAS